MLRAISAGLLLIAATSCLAADFDVDALYQKWKEEDSRTLEGWRVLDDPTLIEKLGPLGAKFSPDGGIVHIGNSHRANFLLHIAYGKGLAGAPLDTQRSAKYLRANEWAPRDDAYALLRPNFEVRYVEGVIEVHMPAASFVEEETWTRLAQQADDGNAACYLMLTQREDPEFSADENKKHQQNALELAAKNGCVPAMAILGQLKVRGTGIERDAQEGVDLLKKAGDAGYIPAILELARFFDYPEGQRPNLEFCRLYLMRAADAGSIDAMKRLRQLPDVPFEAMTVEKLFEQYCAKWAGPVVKTVRSNRTLIITPPNPVLLSYPKVADWLKQRVDPVPALNLSDEAIGWARAMYGECLLRGIGGAEQDIALGLHWLYQALKGKVACRAAGVLYAEGKVTQDDEAYAMMYLSDAVDAEFQPAMRIECAIGLQGLGAAYERLGYGDQLRKAPTAKDALVFLEQLADEGDIESIKMMADHTRRAGRDWLPWAAKAAEEGDGAAAASVADYYAEEDHRDDQKRLGALRVAERDPATREWALAEIAGYEDVDGRRRCSELLPVLDEALVQYGSVDRFLDEHRWFAGVAQNAAKYGADGGLYALCLIHGHGVTADFTLARKLLNHDADQPIQSFLLAQMMEQGLGAEPDRRGAVWVYEAVAEAGGVYAMHRLGELKLEDKDQTKAAEWFKKAAEGGCLPSMVALAKAYHDGAGVDKDAAKAKEWAKKAADAGNEAAKKLLEEWKS